MKVKYGKAVVELSMNDDHLINGNDKVSIGSIKDRLLVTFELPLSCRDDMKLIYQGHVLHNDLETIEDVIQSSSRRKSLVVDNDNNNNNNSSAVDADDDKGHDVNAHTIDESNGYVSWSYADVLLVLMCNPKKSHDTIDPKLIKSLQDRVIDDISSSDDNQNHLVNSSRTSSSTSHGSSRETSYNQYKFHSIQTLPGLPDEDKAREILESLANDIGVLAVLKKHRWSVGALCELYPEGQVGVSDVCVMGLNQNNGQKILLRLRTDDLQGFRKIWSIKKVLCHELAHNKHNNHDNDFYMLMREIEHDVVALDWRNSKSYSTTTTTATVNGNKIKRQNEAAIHTSSLSMRRPATSSSGVHVLGGQMDPVVKQFIPAKYLAGAAALKRLSEEEQEIEDHCGGSVRSSIRSGGGHDDGGGGDHDDGGSGDLDGGSGDRDGGVDADAQSSDSQYHHDGNSASVSIHDIGLMAHDESGDALLHGGMMVMETISSSDNDPSTSSIADVLNRAHDDDDDVVKVSCDDDMDIQEVVEEGIHDHDHHNDSIPICKENINMLVLEITVDDIAIDDDDARQLLEFQLIENTLFGHIDEVIANAYELNYSDTILMKLTQFRQAFEMIIQSIKNKHKHRDFTHMDSDISSSSSISEIMRDKLTKLLTILYKVLSNLMNFPTHDKYRSINKSCAIYQNQIQVYDGMLELLAIVGFQSDNVDVDGVHVDSTSNSSSSRKELVMKRSIDQALLYLLCSVLQHMLDIVVRR